MGLHKVSVLACLLVLGIFVFVDHVDAKGCSRECGNFGYGICPEKPICTNCCSGFKGCSYYNAKGDFICEGESDPKNPNDCTFDCDPQIAYSKCPRSEGKIIIKPTGCTTCCTGYQGCYYFDEDGEFVCEGESPLPKTTAY